MAFTGHQLKILEKGLKIIFSDLGIRRHLRMVKTSEKSISLYIDFPECEVRRVRISTHKPSISQKDYINIYEEEVQKS